MSASERAGQIAALAHRLVEYLQQQTGNDIVEPGAVSNAYGPSHFLLAFERLDAALDQIGDLASVYADDPRATLEPLVLPTAALAGEYLRAALGARWHEPNDDPLAGEALILVLPDGIAIELVGVARAAILSSAPNLTAVARRLVGEGYGARDA